ncbi:hypothetical protein A2U01_0103091 [Trifolium medium]|uniref:Uncharacterized protein n=1 Tax=Trifolium medium TaxID=97028 RepID=A0A392V117_9FABA|nr:hypothetical protein [Trifolium medium]
MVETRSQHGGQRQSTGGRHGGSRRRTAVHGGGRLSSGVDRWLRR